MTLMLTITTDNEAFSERGPELARIFRKLADAYERWGEPPHSAIMDANGNRVGTITDDDA